MHRAVLARRTGRTGLTGRACRALRLAAAPDALVIETGTDIVVRTPARPDHRGGNVVDLAAPPTVEVVPQILARARRSLAAAGAAHAHVRWEQPEGTGAPEIAAALTQHGFASRVTLMFERTVAPRVARRPVVSAATLVRLPAPAREGGPADPGAHERWRAADELQRCAALGGGEVWQRWDAAGQAWDRARVRALARLGRADVWLATVHEEPVASLTVLRDGRGCTLLCELVVHPAHRDRGHGTALIDAATAAEHAATPGTRVFAEIDPGGAAEHMWRRDGTVVAEVVAALGPAEH